MQITNTHPPFKMASTSIVLPVIVVVVVSLMTLSVDCLQWTKIPRSQEVRPGQTVVLQCALQNPQAQLIWIKRDSKQVR